MLIVHRLMPCENNHSAICNSTKRYYYAALISKFFGYQTFLALRDIFDFFDYPFKIMPVAYTYDDLYSIMIDFEHEFALRYQYKQFWIKKFIEYLTTGFSIFVEPKNLDQYLLCKGLSIMLLFHLISWKLMQFVCKIRRSQQTSQIHRVG